MMKFSAVFLHDHLFLLEIMKLKEGILHVASRQKLVLEFFFHLLLSLDSILTSQAQALLRFFHYRPTYFLRLTETSLTFLLFLELQENQRSSWSMEPIKKVAKLHSSSECQGVNFYIGVSLAIAVFLGLCDESDSSFEVQLVERWINIFLITFRRWISSLLLISLRMRWQLCK